MHNRTHTPAHRCTYIHTHVHAHMHAHMHTQTVHLFLPLQVSAWRDIVIDCMCSLAWEHISVGLCITPSTLIGFLWMLCMQWTSNFWVMVKPFFACVCDLDLILLVPFNCISFRKFSRQLSTFLLCSFGLNSAWWVISTVYFFMKVSFSPDIILGGWIGLKHCTTN